MNPDDISEGARLHDYGDLFREVADALKKVGLFQDALRYYTPIQHTNEYADISFFMAMGDCCLQLNDLDEAENCFLTVAEHDARNVDSRVQLAKLYEGTGMTEQALRYVNEAVLLGRQEIKSRRRRKDTRLEQLAREFQLEEFDPDAVSLGPVAPKPTVDGAAATLTAAPAPTGKPRGGEGDRTEQIKYLYSKMSELHPKLREGDPEATEDWLDIADALLRDFRANRVFYPISRNITFLGYSREAHRRAGKLKSRSLMDEMQEMAGRLQESLGKRHPLLVMLALY